VFFLIFRLVFEGGIFVGAVGLERTYFVLPDGGDFKEPTDLNGVVTLRYKRTPKKIRARIEKLMTR